MGQGAGEERPRRRAVTAFADDDVDELIVLIDRAVEIDLSAGGPDVRFVDQPANARRVPGRSGGVDELGERCLHPPIDHHVIDLDTAFGRQFFTSR